MIFLSVLWAEILKTKRTIALRMVVAAPAAVVLLMIFLLSQAPGIVLNQRGDPWLAMARAVLILWVLLMLPLYVTLETALMSSLDHAENQWKALLARPVPRWTFYIAKLLVVLVMTGASTVLLVSGILGAGTVLPVLQPELRLGSSVPWTEILRKTAEVTGLAFLSLTIQHWVSMRWRSFTVAVGVGIVAVVVGYIMVGASRLGSPWIKYFPWALPMTALANPAINVEPSLWMSGVMGLVVAAAGCWDFCRREVR